MNHLYNHSMQLPKRQILTKTPGFLCKRFWMFILLPLFLLAGTAQAQTQISDWNDLDDIRNNLDGNYILVNDLDENTAGYATVAGPAANSGAGFDPIGGENTPFTGSFDGQSFTIDGLHINRADVDYTALFSTTDQAILSNIEITNGTITGGSFIGITGGARTAGLVGAMSGGEISNSHVNGDITGTKELVGGLVGELNGGTISASSTSGQVNGDYAVGGLIGATGWVSDGGNISESHATATVTGGGWGVGGLVGEMYKDSRIENVYATGDVTGEDRVGGLVGLLDDSDNQIINAWSSGKVTADSQFGGLIGEDDSGATVQNSLWDVQASEIGSANDNNFGATGITTAEMKNLATFTSAGWDFAENTGVWAIEQGNRISYPYLQSIDYDEPGTDPAVNPIPGLEDLFTLELSGDAGWRMLSLPVGNVEVSTLAGQNLVQGIPGGNDFYNDDVNYEDAAPNLIHYSDNEGWQNFTNFDSGITSGQGFIWYLFNNTEANSVELPFSLSVSGSSPSSDVVIPMNSNDDFTLIGNPFSGDLDASDVSGWGDLQATARTWNPAAGDNGEYEITTSEESPFTGFFVEKSESGSGDITIPVAAGSSKQSESERFNISLNLQGVNANGVVVSDHSTSVVFREGAEHGWDIYDATKLVPLLSSYASIGIVGERAGEARIKAIDSRPIDIEQAIHLPLGLRVENFGGEFDLSAEMQNLPESWLVFLHDKQTGQTVDLASGSHHFSYQPVSQAKAVSEIEHNIPERFKQSAEQAIDRFTLTIDPSESALDPGSGRELPDRISLSQNYPNPFNPATQIRYELPQAGQVSLEVFDMAGRRVAELVNGQVNAGVHTVSFDGSGLSSGVYMYRLQAGGQVFTRKLTLIK